MKKNYKKILIVLFSLIFIIGVLAVYKNFQSNYKTINININNEFVANKKNSPTKQSQTNTVSLTVLGKTYTTQIKNGDSVYSVMNDLQNNKKYDFNFQSKNYPSLGAFVTKINGVEGSSGAYWIYYVDNKEASIGVSKYILKSGDIITWKQKAF